MGKNTWRTVAIIFIILFILETILFISLIIFGMSEIDKETQCKSICFNYNADSFVYESPVCSCYNQGEVFQTEIIK